MTSIRPAATIETIIHVIRISPSDRKQTGLAHLIVAVGLCIVLYGLRTGDIGQLLQIGDFARIDVGNDPVTSSSGCDLGANQPAAALEIEQPDGKIAVHTRRANPPPHPVAAPVFIRTRFQPAAHDRSPNIEPFFRLDIRHEKFDVHNSTRLNPCFTDRPRYRHPPVPSGVESCPSLPEPKNRTFPRSSRRGNFSNPVGSQPSFERNCAKDTNAIRKLTKYWYTL